MFKTSTNHDVKEFTTFGISAGCSELVTFDSPTVDLPRMWEKGYFSRPFMVVGGGSNLLFTADYTGTIIRCISHKSLVTKSFPEAADAIFSFDAGWALDDVCRELATMGYWGMENLSGIPGTIGGAAVQNVGAYGVELNDVAVAVDVYDTVENRFVTFSIDECGYGYRTSRFKGPDQAGRYIVTSVLLGVSKEGSPRLGYGALKSTVEAMAGKAEVTPELVRRAVIDMRDAKLPPVNEVGSAGSFFKNPEVSTGVYDAVVAKAREMWGDDTEVPRYDLPDGRVKIPAAWLIDRCGWKGYRHGGAAVWEKQPLVIVNLTGEATATDVLQLQQKVVDDIEAKFAITLHPEVIFVK